jgi:hypothetical protein
MASLRTAIGWGMPWHQFEEATTLDCEAHATLETLEAVLAGASREAFEIDAAAIACRHTRGAQGATANPVTRNCLIENFLVHEGDELKFGDPRLLFLTVDDNEEAEPSHAVFFPDLYHRRKWSRSDDELDLALLYYWQTGSDRFAEIDNEPQVRYVAYGHGVWKSAVMTEDGSPVWWSGFADLQDRPEIVPRVPLEIRWYLTRLGILDDVGVNTLRPIVARWVS